MWDYVLVYEGYRCILTTVTMLTTCGCSIIQFVIVPLTQQRLLIVNVFNTWSNQSSSASTDVDDHARLPSLTEKQKVKEAQGQKREEGEREQGD